ncbi:MAG: GNAT family N-acetyltransferase [Candidatus Aureabacteria bacterium]|nr:GNAT family N-acetyltransferase [Candidatus Auribacterota bacterium]
MNIILRDIRVKLWTKYIRKAINHYNEKGLISFIKRIWYLSGSFIFVYRKAIMYHKQLTASSLNFTDNLNINRASEEDIDEEYNDIWYTKKQALERLSKGYMLFLAKDRDKGENTFYGWNEFLNISIPWLGIENLNIPSNIGYITGMYVPRQYRGRLLSRRSLKFIEKYLFNNTTVDRIFAITSPTNVASNGIIRSTGYISYQYVKYFKIIGFKLYIVESLGNKKRKRKIFIQNSKFWNVFMKSL